MEGTWGGENVRSWRLEDSWGYEVGTCCCLTYSILMSVIVAVD